MSTSGIEVSSAALPCDSRNASRIEGITGPTETIPGLRSTATKMIAAIARPAGIAASLLGEAIFLTGSSKGYLAILIRIGLGKSRHLDPQAAPRAMRSWVLKSFQRSPRVQPSVYERRPRKLLAELWRFCGGRTASHGTVDQPPSISVVSIVTSCVSVSSHAFICCEPSRSNQSCRNCSGASGATTTERPR